MMKEASVLIGEDDPHDVFLLQRAFRDAQINNPLQAVRDGQEVIDYLSGTGAFSDRASFPFPVLLILDLKMPRKTGMDVLKWLRHEEGLCSLPVIMFSSSALPTDVERAYLSGANAFIVKPSGVPERTEFVRMIKGFWLNLNEPPLVSSEGLETARSCIANCRLCREKL